MKNQIQTLGLLLAFLFVLSILAAPSFTAHAQVPGRNIGLGGQVGDPSGITLKVYQRRGFAYDFLAAWDWDDYFLFNLHGLFERPLQDSPLNYYLGPGAFVAFRDRDRGERDDDDVTLGISGNFGINFFIERFEVYLQITPQLGIIPETDGNIGGGVGLRYYF